MPVYGRHVKGTRFWVLSATARSTRCICCISASRRPAWISVMPGRIWRLWRRPLAWRRGAAPCECRLTAAHDGVTMTASHCPYPMIGGALAMKWCRFQDGDTATYGIIEGDTVIAVNGSPFDVWTRTPKTYPLATVKLLVPVI